MAPFVLKFKGNKPFSPLANLNDPEALTRTWKVCTKVASYLEQGARLENLSWRLWYVQSLLVENDNARSKRDFKKLSKNMGDKLEKDKGRSIEDLPVPAYDANKPDDRIRKKMRERDIEACRVASAQVGERIKNKVARGEFVDTVVRTSMMKDMQHTFAVDADYKEKSRKEMERKRKEAQAKLRREAAARERKEQEERERLGLDTDQLATVKEEAPLSAGSSSSMAVAPLSFPTLFSADTPSGLPNWSPSALLVNPAMIYHPSNSYGEDLIGPHYPHPSNEQFRHSIMLENGAGPSSVPAPRAAFEFDVAEFEVEGGLSNVDDGEEAHANGNDEDDAEGEDEGKGSTNANCARTQPSPDVPAQEEEGETVECKNCGVTHTPLWRRTVLDELNCNACGLYAKSHKRLRPRSLRAASGSRGLSRRGGSANGGSVDSNSNASSWEMIELQNCSNCTVGQTPLWRKDPDGNTLCNACGLYYKLHGEHRPLTMKSEVPRKRARVRSRGSRAATTSTSTDKSASVERGFSTETVPAGPGRAKAKGKGRVVTAPKAKKSSTKQLPRELPKRAGGSKKRTPVYVEHSDEDELEDELDALEEDPTEEEPHEPTYAYDSVYRPHGPYAPHAQGFESRLGNLSMNSTDEAGTGEHTDVEMDNHERRKRRRLDVEYGSHEDPNLHPFSSHDAHPGFAFHEQGPGQEHAPANGWSWDQHTAMPEIFGSQEAFYDSPLDPSLTGHENGQAGISALPLTHVELQYPQQQQSLPQQGAWGPEFYRENAHLYARDDVESSRVNGIQEHHSPPNLPFGPHMYLDMADVQQAHDQPQQNDFHPADVNLYENHMQNHQHPSAHGEGSPNGYFGGASFGTDYSDYSNATSGSQPRSNEEQPLSAHPMDDYQLDVEHNYDRPLLSRSAIIGPLLNPRAYGLTYSNEWAVEELTDEHGHHEYVAENEGMSMDMDGMDPNAFIHVKSEDGDRLPA